MLIQNLMEIKFNMVLTKSIALSFRDGTMEARGSSMIEQGRGKQVKEN